MRASSPFFTWTGRIFASFILATVFLVGTWLL